MTCPDCTAAATNPNWGGYSGNCHGCDVRAVANSPAHIRDGHYRRALNYGGPEAMAHLKREVRAEYERIQALRGKTCTSSSE